MQKIGIFIERQRAFGRKLCDGVSRYARNHGGWSMTMLDWDDFSRPERFRLFDGFIARLLNKRISNVLNDTARPVVNVFETDDSGNAIQVMQDATAIARLAVRHFIDHRFENFAFFGHEGILYSDLRRQAFVDLLKGEGFECNVYPTPPANLRDFEYSVMRFEKYSANAERRAIERWLKRLPKPIAVFCSHDLRAYQLIERCHALGICIPDEVAVLGVDNDDLICNFTEPTISSIDPNAETIGFRAAEMLDTLLRGRKADNAVMIPPSTLIERKSTATYPIDPSWMSDSLVFIHANAHKRISAADVFRHINRSHTVVDEAFRRILGTSVSREIADSRLKTARRLITTTSLSFAEVAEKSGFASIHYFTRSFTSAFGMSPSRFRDKHRRPAK